MCTHVTVAGVGGARDHTLLAPGLRSEQRGHEAAAHRRAHEEAQAPPRSSPVCLLTWVPGQKSQQRRPISLPSHGQEELPFRLHIPEGEQPFGNVCTCVITVSFNVRFTCAQSKRMCLFFFINCLLKANSSCKIKTNKQKKPKY